MDEFILKKSKFEPYSIWEWNMIDTDIPIKQFLQTQTEKTEVSHDISQFSWTSFCVNLLLAYEYCEKMKDFKKSLEHIAFCEHHLQSLTDDNCQDSLFTSIHSSLWHTTLATKVNILRLSKAIDAEPDIKENIKRFEMLKPLNKREKAGILGIKAGVFIQYGSRGHHQTLELAKAARDMDPDQAEWHFLVGNAMGRLRRTTNGPITDEEVEAIEKASLLEENATFIVHTAQLYQEYSTSLFYNKSKGSFNKSKQFAKEAIQKYKDAMAMRPNCPALMARVAHGLLRIKHRDLPLSMKYVKELLDKVVEMTPNNAMVYHDLGVYYEKYEHDVEKAIVNLEKSHRLHNIRAFVFLMQIKWKYGFEREILSDLEKALGEYKDNVQQEELLTHYGAICLLTQDNGMQSALKYFNKALDINPAGSCLQKYSFNGK